MTVLRSTRNDEGPLLITAGAGIGVDSGLPDFRGTEGFWQAYPALAASGIRFEEIASPDAFERDPAVAWGFYGHRLALYRRTVPHAGFGLLKHWGERMPRGYGVFTSNVDGQFQKAGFDPMRVHECHGSLHYLQCMLSCGSEIWSADAFEPEVDEARCRLHNDAPRCPHCGALARPNVLMFNDGGWHGARSQYQRNRLDQWIASLAGRRLVVVELGAGTAIPSVRAFGEYAVKMLHGHLVRINPRAPQVPGGPQGRHIGLALGAGEALRMLAEAMGPDWA